MIKGNCALVKPDSKVTGLRQLNSFMWRRLVVEPQRSFHPAPRLENNPDSVRPVFRRHLRKPGFVDRVKRGRCISHGHGKRAIGLGAHHTVIQGARHQLAITHVQILHRIFQPHLRVGRRFAIRLQYDPLQREFDGLPVSPLAGMGHTLSSRRIDFSERGRAPAAEGGVAGIGHQELSIW